MPDKNEYLKLLNLSPAEVLSRVREWSSELSEDEHLIRSVVLEIDANLEAALHDVLYEHMRSILPIWGKPEEDAKARQQLRDEVDSMWFGRVWGLLKPCMLAFTEARPELAYVPFIHKARNAAAHPSPEGLDYRGRNLFKDKDCLAQLYFDYWATMKGIQDFKQHLIDDPTAIAREHARHYNACKKVGATPPETGATEG